MTPVRSLSALLLVILLVVPGLASAQRPALPSLIGPVNDFANVIDAVSASAIESRSRALQSASGDAIVVVTVPDIEGFAGIEEYAVRLFEQAGIGERARDNGLLIVLALQERQVRIEVGYGLEDIITDGYAGEVIRTYMAPAFREGRYGEGLLAAVTAIAQRIAERRNVNVEGLPAEPPARRDETNPLSIVAIIVLLLILILSSRGGGGRGGIRRYGRGPFWYGGVGGFGGFGGGRSGGGGATGRW
jgi:uncharacterized protein